MIPFERIYLDTNIFIFAVEGSDKVSGLLSELLIRAEVRPGMLFTSEVTIAELLVKPLKFQDNDLIKAFDNLVFCNKAVRVSPLPPMAYRYAAALRSHRASIKLPDALHLGAAMAGNASHFLTLDTGIAPPLDLGNLRIIDNQPDVDLDIIRPDLPTLDSLLKSLAP